MNGLGNTAWIVDAHVHLHQCFDASAFLDSASRNLGNLARRSGVADPSQWKAALLFTESFGDDGFGWLSRAGKVGAWNIREAPGSWLLAQHEDGRTPVHIAPGRQIVTRERLEVAALGTTRVVPDGQPIEKVIDELLAEGTLLALPWGFGKWTGHRGAIVERLLERYPSDRLLLGDNGGRAAMSIRPPMFSRAESSGRIVIAGTDPLPFASESTRVGGYASLVPAGETTGSLLQSLRKLRETPPILGSRAALPYFIKSQIRMQLRKR